MVNNDHFFYRAPKFIFTTFPNSSKVTSIQFKHSVYIIMTLIIELDIKDVSRPILILTFEIVFLTTLIKNQM